VTWMFLGAAVSEASFRWNPEKFESYKDKDGNMRVRIFMKITNTSDKLAIVGLHNAKMEISGTISGYKLMDKANFDKVSSVKNLQPGKSVTAKFNVRYKSFKDADPSDGTWKWEGEEKTGNPPITNLKITKFTAESETEVARTPVKKPSPPNPPAKKPSGPPSKASRKAPPKPQSRKATFKANVKKFETLRDRNGIVNVGLHIDILNTSNNGAVIIKLYDAKGEVTARILGESGERHLMIARGLEWNNAPGVNNLEPGETGTIKLLIPYNVFQDADPRDGTWRWAGEERTGRPPLTHLSVTKFSAQVISR